MLNSDTSPLSDPVNGPKGLKSNSNFSTEARFDLILPEDVGDAYGVRLVDQPAPPGNNNNTVDLVVLRDATGVHLALRQINVSISSNVVLETIDLPPGSFDQIVLKLNYLQSSFVNSTSGGKVTASFDLLSNGAVTSSGSFTSQGTIFQGEDFVRVQLVGQSTQAETGVYKLVGTYGTLTMAQDGQWHYLLADQQANVQALGTGQTVTDTFTVHTDDGAGRVADQQIVINVTGTHDTPTITGDLTFTVNKGLPHTLTTDDFSALEPDSTASQLTFTVANPTNGHITVNNATSISFTQQQLAAGLVAFVHDGSNTTQASFQVSVSDGTATSATMTVLGAVPTVSAKVLAAGGFDSDTEFNEMGGGALQAGWTSTEFTVVNQDANRRYVYDGTGFQLDSIQNPTDVQSGTISAIHVFTLDATPQALFDFTGIIDAAAWYDAVVASNGGDQNAGETLTSEWTFSFTGGAGSDTWFAGDLNDFFKSSGGNDVLDGQGGYDRVNYGAQTAPIDVALAAGTVTKYTDSTKTVVGSADTLNAVEFITGTAFNDIYNAANFSSTSTNSGSIVTSNVNGTSNEFEGLGGNDVITGNGSTRISYLHATSAVVVDLAAGTADGDASVGHDTFSALPTNGPFTSGVGGVRGSYFNDFLYGSNSTGTETFEGRGGNDYIDGRGGFDRAVYGNEDAGITVNLGAGTVLGGVNTGTDTLRSVEGITGTEFNDSYDASTFTASNAGSPSVNSGNGATGGVASNFNEFEGRGGDDTITGNGNTRVAYYNATASVTVMLTGPSSGTGSGAGTSIGTAHNNLLSYANIDPAGVGSDTFTGGVTRVTGSEFNDLITGNVQNNTFDGRGGNDMLDGRGGNDTLTGGTGSDRFTYSTNVGSASGGSGGADIVTDFSQSDFDRLDIRGTGLGNFGSVSPLISQSGGNTVITFASTAQAPGTNTLTLQGFTGTLSRSDFIFAGQVAVTVQAADGYNFGTLYDDLAGVNLALTTHDASNYILVNPTAGPQGTGLIFDLVNSSGAFTYDPAGNPLSGAVNNILIYDMSYNLLATTNGWSTIPTVTSLLNAASSYAANHANTTGLDSIFVPVSYSAAGNFSTSFDNNSVNGGGDTFISGSFNDVFNGLTNGNGGDFNYGDTVDYSHVASAVTVNLGAAGGSQTSGGGGNDVLLNIENLRGSAFNDTLTGDANSNVLEGGLGNDTLDGGVGAIDTASYEHATSGVTVSLATTAQQNTIGAGLDTLSNFEALRGSAWDDTLTGNGTSTLEGGAGDDHLIGQSNGADTASYQHATAGVNVNLALPGAQDTAGAGTDTLTNIKNLTGSSFADHLNGDANNNIMSGGFGGNDVLTGGLGADTFQFGGGNVTVTDFSTAQGDKIELFNLQAATHADAVTAINALISASTGDTFSFSNNGTLTLTNVDVHSLHASDFILHP
jgi:VCBS repeat-containing protein